VKNWQNTEYIMQLETEKLFYTHSYLTETEAWLDDIVKDEKGNVIAVLSKTIFYPQGGGQLGDRGTLQLRGNDLLETVAITTTKKLGDGVGHYLQCSPEQFAELTNAVGSAQVNVKLDWKLRYHQMRIHSAGHLLHCMMEQVKGASIPYPARSPLTDQDGENQYEATDLFDADTVAKAVPLLNAFLREPHTISTRADEAKGHGFRWWQCESWEIPCGGVHPADAKEIGQVRGDYRVKKGTTRASFALVDA
jgi:alanyl-tRNA synthetase